MPRNLAFPVAALAALILIAAGCDQQPTEVQAFPIDGLAFSYTIGDPGETDGVPLTPIKDGYEPRAYWFPSTNETTSLRTGRTSRGTPTTPGSARLR